MIDLPTIWFLLVGVLLAGYVILDGFDFGVGILSLFSREPDERRLHLNAIGPVWDGNEVWLLTGGGALFAAFPIVYAEVFSNFYLAFMLLLAALITRAVSMEFRSKVEAPLWRRIWDWAFGVSSLLPAVLVGVAFGNILRGVPIDENMRISVSFLALLNPYAILIGVFSLALFTMHGAIYMTMKSDGELRARMRKWASGAWWVVVALYVLASIGSYTAAPHLFEKIANRPLFWVVLPLLFGSAVATLLSTRAGRNFTAFLASSSTIACLLALAGISLYPRLVPSTTELANSLTIHNARSSDLTQTVMLVIALIGMPIVIGYTIFIYRVFRGKVVISEESY